jgi:type IV pilus assembly protein PilQ
MELRGKKVRIAALLALAGLATYAAVATAQQADPEGGNDSGDVITVNGQAATGRTFTITKPGTFDEAHFKDADIRSVLRLLSTEGKRNIVASNSVSGTITADFYDVSFNEALDAIMRATGYVYEKKGDFYFVYTPEEYAAVKQKETTVVRVIRLHYVRPQDIQAMVAPLLSSTGSITLNPAAATGIASSSESAGGDDYSGGDVIVVKDIEENVEKIEKVIAELDVKPRQLLIEATMLRATLTEDNGLGIDITSLGEGITIPNWDVGIDYSTDFTGGVSSGGLNMTVTGGKAEFLIRAIESVTDVTVMANPKLLVLNKQRGEVLIGNRDGYLTTVVTETSAVQTVEFLETGTRLIVRPYIGQNGNIRMEIHPEDSSGSVRQVGDFVLPSETTTEVTSNVMVRDGHTVVIGGLFRETTTVGRSQVPLVGNVPYVGSLFRRTSDSTVREEVIILLTPHILEQRVAEGLGEQMQNDVERQRIGARNGLQWWGRGRLAQTHLNWARKYAQSGNQELALWNTDLALSLDPRMADAIHLKEKLTGKALWECKNKQSEVKYLMERIMMEELGKNWREVVPPNRPLDNKNLDSDVREKFGMIGRKGLEEQRPLALETLAPDTRSATGQETPAPEQADPTAGEPAAVKIEAVESFESVTFSEPEAPVEQYDHEQDQPFVPDIEAPEELHGRSEIEFHPAQAEPVEQAQPEQAAASESFEAAPAPAAEAPRDVVVSGNARRLAPVRVDEIDADIAEQIEPVDLETFWRDLEAILPHQDIWREIRQLERQYGQAPEADESELKVIDQATRLELEGLAEEIELLTEEQDEDLTAEMVEAAAAEALEELPQRGQPRED